ncbi:MAG: helix-turn-helix domain-containing protein, partial [Verrucomicrobiales bacterium]|nr:helix-turn-helix domain-containing protein [Verrucomicrobiales bacterium]
STDISTAHLSKSFSAIVGCSFREERRRLRIELTSKLLADTDLKISAVARRIGLLDTSW